MFERARQEPLMTAATTKLPVWRTACETYAPRQCRLQAPPAVDATAPDSLSDAWDTVVIWPAGLQPR